MVGSLIQLVAELRCTVAEPGCSNGRISRPQLGGGEEKHCMVQNLDQKSIMISSLIP